MLMYATICKSFTGQLRGWWDNYMSIEQKAVVINVISDSEGVDNLGMALVINREDVVYTLVLTILEHFNGRFTNQYEIVHTLLNGLHCRTLGEFRWYKDTYMSRIMELRENSYDHWKAKFIDDFPPLFAERVRKSLRTSHGWTLLGLPRVEENNEFYKLKNLQKLGFLFGTPERYSIRQPVIRTSVGLFVTTAK
ncbi:hypothetical protein H5410_031275 [Solanum commersonii]|uniref:DUF7746 domain-containing protein n=1 Tax=Solanum commersonii TaxID=4109 RepID=A0A9J5YHZ2_SOLCO|nr:hypothetical protein H5410_031275 [Solanum commersonii]